ncbi:MAG: glutaredoxin 3 [Pseudomonadota bacterium]
MSNVVMYATRICPFCMAADRLLKQKGVEYEKSLVDKHPEERPKMEQLSGGRHTVPQIFIDDTHVGGCDELYALNSTGELDSMLSAS